MKTIKFGSIGEDVISLQIKLGIEHSGIFSSKTEEAVKKFQKKHNLAVDGIVGPKTWAALGFSQCDSRCIDPSVIYKPLSVHITKSPNRTPMYLAIHFNAGSSSKPGKAQNEYNTFVARSASADFTVDDRDMVQFNPDIRNCCCWSVGDAKYKYSSGGSLHGKATNKNTISIEICSTCSPATREALNSANHSGWSFTEAALDNAVTLAKMIMKRYDIPIERVVRHYDISGKLCPGIIGWNDEAIYTQSGKKTKESSDSLEWLEFKKRLSSN